MNFSTRHPRSGTVLAGKWQMEGLLGEGGTGAVFAARQSDGVRVAVKVLHRRHLDHPVLVARFRREGPLANRVGHPDVVRVLGDGTTDDGCPFLVTELFEGETLEQERLRVGTLAVSEVLALGQRLCDVAQSAHDKGVLHRDIKPQNLFRTRGGALKVLDFGLGCEAEPTEPGITSLDSVLGTVGFMAPEQAQGRWDLVDEQTDVWAIGATLLKLATGLDAHDGSTSQERMALAATTPVRRLAERAPWLDPRVAAALDRSMAFSRAERFPSARLFGEALAQCVPSPPEPKLHAPGASGTRSASSAASAPPGGATPLTPSTVGRPPGAAAKVAPLVGAGVFLVLVAAAGGLAAWTWHTATERSSPSPSAPTTTASAPRDGQQTPSPSTRPPSESAALPVLSAPKSSPSARPASSPALPASPTRTTTRCSDRSACMANATCDDKTGYCVCTKAPGRLLALACDGACVPQDRDHCGGCSTRCGPVETCSDPVNGSPLMKCVACTSRYLHAGVCGERCVDLDNDATNCGRCGKDCRATEPSCRGKACICRAGQCVAR